MKFLKRTLITLMTLVLCLTPVLAPALTVSADGATTYYVKYRTDSNTWGYQKGSTWDGGQTSYDVKNLNSEIKDGDLLVIDGDTNILLTVDVKLENLTIVHSTLAVITAKSINNFYAINDSVSAINGDVANAYVYDGCLCNFNNSVTNLYLCSEKNVNLAATVQVVGTVDYLKASGKDYTHFEFYNFEANSLLIEKGILKTVSSKYSSTPQATATPAPATTTPAASSSSTASSGEYDEVPKTGDSILNPLWFLGIAALCIAGQYKLNKKSR